MAFGLKHWTGAAALACALVAVAKLPPGAFEPRGDARRAPLPEEVRYRVLRDDVIRSQRLLRRLHWSDSLPRLLGAEADDGWSFRLDGLDSAAAGPAAVLREEFRRDVEAIPNRRPDVLVAGYAALVPRTATPEGAEGPARDFLYGLHGGSPYCIATDVRPTSVGPTGIAMAFSQMTMDGLRRRNVLGVCRWIAEFGLPGPMISRWIGSGGSLFLAEPVPPPPPATARPWYDLGPRRRGPFGLGWRPSVADRCRAGVAAACAAYFRAPIRNDPFSVTVGGFPGNEEAVTPERAWFGWRGFFGHDEWTDVLARLYAEFGAERARVFWTSSAEVEAAFTEAFQVEPGTWLAEQARLSEYYTPPGPLPRERATLWALLVLAMSSALAVSLGTRRSVAR